MNPVPPHVQPPRAAAGLCLCCPPTALSPHLDLMEWILGKRTFSEENKTDVSCLVCTYRLDFISSLTILSFPTWCVGSDWRLRWNILVFCVLKAHEKGRILPAFRRQLSLRVGTVFGCGEIGPRKSAQADSCWGADRHATHASHPWRYRCCDPSTAASSLPLKFELSAGFDV